MFDAVLIEKSGSGLEAVLAGSMPRNCHKATCW